MAIPIGEAERERREANEELEGARAQVAVLSVRINELMNVVNGWDAIIAAKRKRGAGGEDTVSAPNTGALDPPVAPLLVESRINLGNEEEEGENKTQFVRDHINAHADTGATPDDLKKAAKAAGMKHPPSWPYGPLQRLKKKGEVIKRRGKFYPAKSTTNAQSNLALVG